MQVFVGKAVFSVLQTVIKYSQKTEATRTKATTRISNSGQAKLLLLSASDLPKQNKKIIFKCCLRCLVIHIWCSDKLK